MLLLGVLVILLPRLPTKEPLSLCMDMLLVEEWSMEDKLNDLQLIVAYVFQIKMLLLYMQNFLLRLLLPKASYRQLQSFLCVKMERLYVTKDDF